MTSPSGSTLAEARSFLDANPEVEAVDIVLTDANGVGRGKIIRRHELEGLYEKGRNLPTSILGLDITGEDVHETGLVWDTGDGDLIAWPIPGTLKLLHATKPQRAQVLLSMYNRDGTPMQADPRHALARQIAALEEQGLQPAGAFELEFFLLARERDGAGNVQPAASLVDGRSQPRTEVYSVDHLHGMEPLFNDIYVAAALQDIPVETLISEYAPGQYELTLHYRPNLMQAADDLIQLKRIVKAAARRHGVIACFMAKPFAGHAGSGMHLHVSMKDRDGRNPFSEKVDGERTSVLLGALGGLLSTMAQSMLVFAPHANSWRRFTSNSYAPVSLTWGENNRSVALRIPAGDTKNRRIEHRPSGVDANPYLVGATVLAGIRKGMNENLDPGPETTGNGYGESAGASAMPTDWRSAILAAGDSSFLREALGPQLHKTFLAIKQAEYAHVSQTVSELDYQLYLHEV
ncbi:MAG: glutamine synthetase family protein [Rhizobiaceae bacterium]